MAAALDPELFYAPARLPDEVAGAVRTFGETRRPASPAPQANQAPLLRALARARAVRDDLAKAMAAGPREEPCRQVHGHLLANVDRLLSELDPEGQTRPGGGLGLSSGAWNPTRCWPSPVGERSRLGRRVPAVVHSPPLRWRRGSPRRADQVGTRSGAMFFSRHKSRMPAEAEALPGREQAMPVPARHAVLHTPLASPFPDGLEQAVFGMGCFWGAERKFWGGPRASTPTAGRVGAGLHPDPRRRTRAPGRPDRSTPRPYWSCSTRPGPATSRCSGSSGRTTTPTQRMRQGNDVGTQYRSAVYTFSEAQRKQADASRDAYQPELDAAGYGPITTEIREAPAFYYAEDYHQQYLHKVLNEATPRPRHRGELPGRGRLSRGQARRRRTSWTATSTSTRARRRTEPSRCPGTARSGRRAEQQPWL